MRHGILIPKRYNEKNTVYSMLVEHDYYFEAQSFFDTLGLKANGQTDRDICDEYGIELQDIEVYDRRHDGEKRAIPSLSQHSLEHLLMLVKGREFPEKGPFVDWYFDTLLPLLDYAATILCAGDRTLKKKWIQDGGIRYYTPIGCANPFKHPENYMEVSHES